MSELEKRLRVRREKLYRGFDNLSKSSDFYDLQVKLAEEIIESESNISNNKSKLDWQIHLDRIYSIGDSIAWSVLGKFIIRQLGKCESIKTSISGQKDIFKKLLDDYKESSKKNLYIFSDLTRCITIGDVIKVNSPEDVNIIESKSGLTDIHSAKQILRGRSGRQFSKIFWLSQYLVNGFGKLYQEKKPTKTIEVYTQIETHFDLIPNLLDKCLSNKTSFIQAEKGLIYLAQILDMEEYESVCKSIPKMKHPVLAGTGRLIEEKTETAYHIPILNFPIELKYRILLNEVDINILGILDLEYVKSRAKQFGYEFNYSKTTDAPELRKGAKSYKVHIRFINDILINFFSVDTVLKTMVNLLEKVEETKLELTKKEKEYLKNRPKTHQEFIEFLGKNYVTVKLDKEGNILEAYHMDGTKII